ncbi:MAG: tetratricopeptide repeat protein [Alphaproteobacteria bacterium]|nr:tetratricopeptide repeat protein [Alphaproteobacteria bacterium]
MREAAAVEAGRSLRRGGRLADAIAVLEAAVRRAPGDGEALAELGATLWAARRPAAAIDALRRAVAARPADVETRNGLAMALHAVGDDTGAEAAFAATLAIAPGHFPTRLHAAVARLRIVYRDTAERAAARAAYARDLASLAAAPLPTSAAALAEAADALGSMQPFYLAYQGCDDRDLQALYGGLACRVMAARHPEFAARPPSPGAAPGERIRVGILSGFFRHHSNWKMRLRGWLEDLDRDRFAVHGYFTGSRADAETARARALCERFVEGPRPITAWARAIRDDRLHVLLIPEIGMDPVTVRLAALRLAPVQATSWGHPQTSGMPTIDDFLSSDLMEPAGGAAHYTERLVRLPGLSCRPIAVAVEPATVTRDELGLAADDVVYWCCQQLQKYLPEHDGVFARIAAALPAARFLFIEHVGGARVTDVFRARLAAAFAAVGLPPDRHCRFLPPLPPARFAGVTRLADVFLDSIGWSGCNSTLEALDCAVPVVTLPGAMMRARHSAAILARIGLADAVAADADDYVRRAVALGRDPQARRRLSGRIAAAAPVLRADRAPADGLAHYLRQAAHRSAAPRAPHAEGLAALEATVHRDPADGEALARLGAALWTARRPRAAIDALRRAVAALPDRIAVRDSLANALHYVGDHDGAEAAFAATLALAPDHLPTRLNACVARLRPIYRDAAERVRARAAYAGDLAALVRLPLPGDADALGRIMGARKPFHLAAQGENDRDLQALYGGFLCRVMAARFPDLAAPPPRPGLAPGERIRIGILSGFFRHHSNWKMRLRGWLEDLDRGRFAVHGYFTGTPADAETARARSLCARFVEGARPTAEWARTIRADRLHVLLIPEIGMDPAVVELAALRLAPVQATSWGHPQTSGMPTVDDFLSSDLMEPPDGDAHYTERLVRLPGLSCRPIPVAVDPAVPTRGELGVGDDDVLYWCCQQLHKYLPEDDHVFPRIAAAVPGARFLFVGHGGGDGVETVFRERLARAFAGAGLDAARHCRHLGILSAERFAGVTRASDIFLDSLGWSGCNSTLEALAADLPVVTWPGRLMRARHSAAILRLAGLDETVATSEADYLAIATALGRDAGRRATLRRRVAGAAPALWADRSYLPGLEGYLVRAAEGRR